jgi:uncharacterized protein involved in exopolysaccharide biosynthesis
MQAHSIFICEMQRGARVSPDLKDVIAATIPSVLPTLMVLYGIMSNKNDINHIRTELSSIRGEMGSIRGEMGSMRTQFNAEIGSMRNQFHAEIGALRTEFHADINGLRSDIATLTGISNDLDKRVSRLEDKG